MKNISLAKNQHQGGRFGQFEASQWLSMLFLLVLILMALSPTLAMAAVPPAVASNGPFDPHDNDYFVNMLMKGMLGDVINLNSASANSTFTGEGTLGSVFRAFNLGVAFFGSIIIMFVSIVGILNTGNDGEFLGKRWSSFWVPIRFAVGAAIMLPVTNAGYSFIQALCLWIAGQGVYFADTVWDAVVDKQMDVVSASTISAETPTLALVSGIALSEVCGAYYNQQLVKAGSFDLNVRYNDMWTAFPIPNAYGQVTRVVNWIPAKSNGVVLSTPEERKVEFTLNTCGRISFTENKTIEDGFEDLRTAITGLHKSKIDASHQSLKVDAEDFVAKMYLPDEAAKTAAALKISTNILALDADYKAGLITTVEAKMLTTDAADASRLGPLMKELGFAAAGAFYIDLAKMHGIVRDGLQNVPKYAAPDVAILSKMAGSEDWDIVSGDINRIIASANLAASDKGTYSQVPTKALDVKSPGTSDDNMFASLDGGMDWTDKLAKKLVNALIGTNDEYDTIEIALNQVKTTNISPANALTLAYGSKLSRRSAILQFKDKGDYILNVAGVLQTSYIVANAVVAGAQGGIVGILAKFAPVNPFPVVQKILESLALMVMSIVLGLITIGIALAIVIPMTPFMIWTMGIAGMLVLIVESLVASVIWAVMIMHPSGEGLTSDHSRQGLMILLMLFMRPALMVMGLASGIFMVDPLIDFMNDMFAFAFRSIQTEGFSGFFIVFGMCSVYTTTAIAIIKKCFSMIHVVPDKVLRWIGGGGESLGESELSDRGEAMAGSAGRVGSVGNSAGGKPTEKQNAAFKDRFDGARASQSSESGKMGPPRPKR